MARTRTSPTGADASNWSGSGLSVYFNSNRCGIVGDLTGHLAAFIADAKRTLDVAIYDQRAPNVLTALKSALKAGVAVRIAYDAGATKTSGLMADPKPNGTAKAIKQAGLASVATPVHMTGRHLMHDKFLVRDGRFVWTGSANFTVGGASPSKTTSVWRSTHANSPSPTRPCSRT